MLNSGRLRDQWHTMTRTARARKLLDHREAPEVSVHPQQAHEYEIADGQLVRVTSAHGAYVGRARVTASQKPGQLFAPIHWSDNFAQHATISALAAPVTDPVSGQPEFKQMSVNIEPLAVQSYACLLLRSATADQLHRLLLAADNQLPRTLLHWYRVPLAEGYRYELALDKASNFPAIVEQLFPSDEPQPGRQHLQLPDSERWVLYRGQVELLAFTSRDWHALPDRKVLEGRLRDPLPDDPAQLLHDVAAGARIVCTCLQVSQKEIEVAITNGAASLAELGQLLACGTNCGSCKPEISALLSAQLAVAVE